MVIYRQVGRAVTGEVHDGHSSHFEDVAPQAMPCNSHYERALRLAREPIVYPERVKVFTPSVVISEAQA